MAVGDPHLVRRIEAGRSVTLRTADRFLAFIRDYAGDSGGAYRRERPEMRSSFLPTCDCTMTYVQI